MDNFQDFVLRLPSLVARGRLNAPKEGLACLTFEHNCIDYSIEYDVKNIMVKVEVDNQDVEYRYDALGRRVIRKEGSTQTALLWWGNNECAEYEHGAGQASIQNDIMCHPTRLNAVIARAVEGSKFDLEWYHKNYLDHVYAVSDDSGNLDEHYRYTAFGEATIYNGTGTIQTNTQINNTIMWNTRRLDAVSGYYLYKYRHYDPALGRWLGRDPIEERGGINLYAYVGNDPINRWDYLGLDYFVYLTKVRRGNAGSVFLIKCAKDCDTSEIPTTEFDETPNTDAMRLMFKVKKKAVENQGVKYDPKYDYYWWSPPAPENELEGVANSVKIPPMGGEDLELKEKSKQLAIADLNTKALQFANSLIPEDVPCEVVVEVERNDIDTNLTVTHEPLKIED